MQRATFNHGIGDVNLEIVGYALLPMYKYFVCAEFDVQGFWCGVL